MMYSIKDHFVLIFFLFPQGEGELAQFSSTELVLEQIQFIWTELDLEGFSPHGLN